MEYDFYSYEELGLDKPEYLYSKNNKNILEIKTDIISKAIKLCFERLSFTFTKKHLQHLINATLDESSSKNDKYVCGSLLKNAMIAAKGKLPICQDTGIANVFAWKDNGIYINGDENNAINSAIAEIYLSKKLRLSTTIPSNIFLEHDPQNNLPGNITIFQNSSKENLDKPSYHFLCCAKGGGSSNKTFFMQGTKANLNEQAFENFLKEKIKALGTSACPPYTIAVVAGGLSPEQNLLALKLATCGGFDNDEKIKRMNNSMSLNSNIIRDSNWEKRVLEIAEKTNLGAQFGGKKMAIDAIVLRLPRHGASCPLSIGVSCSAHRNLEMKINDSGIYIEKTVSTPEKLPGFTEALSFANDNQNDVPQIDTNKGMDYNLNILSELSCGQRINISGTILVARDAAHARWKEIVDKGNPLPEYCKKYPICYAGPAQTPTGCVIGSFGPTTAGRMDSYSDFLMSQGASLITIAKGNRSKDFTKSCKTYGGFYLGTIGGAAALIAENYISAVEILDFADLGMEAVRLVTVKNLPAFLLTDNKGKDFYE